MMSQIDTLKEELREIGKTAYSKGMVVGSGGNISFRIGDDMVITPHGVTLGNINPEELIIININNPVTDGVEPSVEWSLHLNCYLKRPEIKAVIHLHSYYSIIAGIMADSAERIMPAYTGSYACKVGKLGYVPLYKSGDENLIEAVKKELESSSVVLMKNHGIIACGENMQKAFNLCEDVEMNARLHFALKEYGALTDEQIAYLKS